MDSSSLQSELAASASNESTITSPSLAEREKMIRAKPAPGAIDTMLSPLSSESLDSPSSSALQYKLTISSSGTQSFLEDGTMTSLSRTIYSESDDEYLQTSQSQSYSLASASTETTQPTSPGRRYGRRYPASPGEDSRMTTETSFEDGTTTDGGFATTFDDESTSPSVPSLTQKRSSSSSRGSPRKGSTAPRIPGRIPGGAHAKLMFIGPDRVLSDDREERGTAVVKEITDAEIETELAPPTLTKSGLATNGLHPSNSQDTIDSTLAAENLKDMERTLKKTRAEFDTGTVMNRRYQPLTIREDAEEAHDTPIKPVADSSGPSFMNRSEIFHETAEAAVAALLSPRDRGSDSASIFSAPSELGSVASIGAMSAFQAPRNETSFGGGTAEGSHTQPFESLARRDVAESLISPETETKLQEMPGKMHDANKTLTDLLTAIASPEDKREVDLGYMVRRKNACGALQVLTANTQNRQHICWTLGVLPALSSVLADTGDMGLKVAFPEKRIRVEYVEARKRAISALMNLVMPKENRIPVVHTPDLVSWLVVIIMDDKGAARRGCCAILAYLGKSTENRLLLVQVPGLVDALSKVLKPKPPRVETPHSAPKKIYPWSSGEESDSSDDEREVTLLSNPSILSGLDGDDDEDEESDETPRVVSAQSPVELTGYDETADEFLRGARQNVFALLTHLMKEKDNAYHFARDSPLISTLVNISKYEDSPSHTLAVKFLAQLTRHRLNTKMLVFKQRVAVPALVVAAQVKCDETRKFACFALQNLSQDKSCRQELAITANLITALCNRARDSRIDEERLAAVSALKNLCDEPANLIPLTNTQDCVSILLQLAHKNETDISEMMQYRACDGLATLSHWLRKIATSGKCLEDAKQGNPPSNGLFVPSLRVISWNQWE